MPEKWTGELLGRMHNARVTRNDLAKELGVGKSYVSMLLNSRRTPADAQERLEAAVDSILARRGESTEWPSG